jgi:tripartite-type tricarboxylate transporter receptor subunit TctC
MRLLVRSTSVGRLISLATWPVRLALLILVTTWVPAKANNWPSRTVTIIVPNAPGGFTDIMARLVAVHFSKKFGQSFVVENRAGGAGVIGAAQVANAQPDGYTFLFTSPSTILTQPLLQKVSYDPDSFIPISILGNLPFILGVKSSLPVKALPEFVAYAKANPGKLNFASAGVGGIGHLASVLFLKIAGIDAVHVAYKSAAPATGALVAGEVEVYFGGSPELIQHVSNDKITMLATSGAQRLPNLPNIPTVGEFYPGFQVSTWEAFMAPPGTPQTIIDLMTQATIEAAKDPIIVERFTSLGIAAAGITQAEFHEVLKKDKVFYADAIHAAGIMPASVRSR